MKPGLRPFYRWLISWLFLSFVARLAIAFMNRGTCSMCTPHATFTECGCQYGLGLSPLTITLLALGVSGLTQGFAWIVLNASKRRPTNTTV